MLKRNHTAYYSAFCVCYDMMIKKGRQELKKKKIVCVCLYRGLHGVGGGDQWWRADRPPGWRGRCCARQQSPATLHIKPPSRLHWTTAQSEDPGQNQDQPQSHSQLSNPDLKGEWIKQYSNVTVYCWVLGMDVMIELLPSVVEMGFFFSLRTNLRMNIFIKAVVHMTRKLLFW